MGAEPGKEALWIMSKPKKVFSIDFAGKRKIFFILSLCIILFIAIMTAVRGVDLSIDFKGGTLLNYTYTGELNLERLTSDTKEKSGLNAVVTQGKDFSSGKDTIQISLTSKEGLTADKQFELTSFLQETYADNQLELISSSDVNPSTGKEFFQKCLVAVTFAAVIMVLYIAWRFKRISGWSAGVMAVVALIHDVIVVFGVFVVCGFPINANFMAVVLTILGYSINDTIVIYDRIRENEKLMASSTPVRELVNRSINQSLTRTINTSVSTIGALAVICIVSLATNIQSIISFAFPMLIGMISGTYSTLCIAGPLWVWWKEKHPDHQGKNKKKSASARTAKA